MNELSLGEQLKKERPLEELLSRDIPFIVEAGSQDHWCGVLFGVNQVERRKRFEKMYAAEDVYSAVRLAECHINQMIDFLQCASKCEKEVKKATGELLKYDRISEDLINGLQYARNCLVIAFPAAYTKDVVERETYNHNLIKNRGRMVDGAAEGKNV